MCTHETNTKIKKKNPKIAHFVCLLLFVLTFTFLFIFHFITKKSNVQKISSTSTSLLSRIHFRLNYKFVFFFKFICRHEVKPFEAHCHQRRVGLQVEHFPIRTVSRDRWPRAQFPIKMMTTQPKACAVCETSETHAS